MNRLPSPFDNGPGAFGSPEIYAIALLALQLGASSTSGVRLSSETIAQWLGYRRTAAYKHRARALASPHLKQCNRLVYLPGVEASDTQPVEVPTPAPQLVIPSAPSLAGVAQWPGHVSADPPPDVKTRLETYAQGRMDKAIADGSVVRNPRAYRAAICRELVMRWQDEKQRPLLMSELSTAEVTGNISTAAKRTVDRSPRELPEFDPDLDM